MAAATMVQIDKDIVKFRFLCEIPTLDITPALKEEECLICKEPYENNGHRPVALPCGHVLGFQCLALWMLSTNFHNHCSLCRAQIYDPSSIREQLSPALTSSFARLEVLAVSADNAISRAQKTRLLKNIKESLRGDKDLRTMTEISDRIVAMWEEFLNKICTESAASDQGNPAAIRAYRVIANRLLGSREQISRCFLEKTFLSSICFYAVSLVVADMGSGRAGDDKTTIRMFVSSRDLLIGGIVGLAVSIPQTPRGCKIFSSAVVSVLLLRVLVPLAGLFLARGLGVLC